MDVGMKWGRGTPEFCGWKEVEGRGVPGPIFCYDDSLRSSNKSSSVLQINVCEVDAKDIRGI